MAREIIRSGSGSEQKPAETAKKTVTRTAQEPAKKAPEQSAPSKDRKSKALPYRIFAWVLWIIAIGFEVVTIMVLTQRLILPGLDRWIWVIIGIVLDMGCAIAAAQLWKKANHINPPSKKNKFLFWLISELGVIMAAVCFIPLIVLILKDKGMDKKHKIIVAIVAIVALLITGVASADFDPTSKEEMDSAEYLLEGEEVYWTAFGRKYHTDQDCQTIRNSQTLYGGTVTEAMESGRSTLCSFCAAKYIADHPDMTAEDIAALNNMKVEGGTTAEIKDLEVITTTLPVVDTVGGE